MLGLLPDDAKQPPEREFMLPEVLRLPPEEKREAPEAFGLIDIDFKEQSIPEFLVAVGF